MVKKRYMKSIIKLYTDDINKSIMISDIVSLIIELVLLLKKEHYNTCRKLLNNLKELLYLGKM